jgi:hypothetical protein
MVPTTKRLAFIAFMKGLEAAAVIEKFGYATK